MQRRSLQVPTYKDVCIFCATRIQSASAGSPDCSQRRFFRNSRAFRRPSSAVVAVKEEVVNQTSESGWRGPPARSGGGWARTATSSDLTVEEQALRNSLRKETTNESTVSSTGARRGGDRVHSYREGAREKPSAASITSKGDKWNDANIWRTTVTSRPFPLRSSNASGWARTTGLDDLKREERAPRNGPGRETATDPYPHFRRLKSKSDPQLPISEPYSVPKAHAEPERLLQRDGARSTRDEQLDFHTAESRNSQIERMSFNWPCPSCGHVNYSRNTACRRCKDTRPSRQNGILVEDETDVARHWEHVRRPGSTASGQQIEPSQTGDAGASETPKAMAKAQTLEQERRLRIEKTKDGRFVGLGGKDNIAEASFLEGMGTPGRQEEEVLSRTYESSKVQSGAMQKSVSRGGWKRFELQSNEDDYRETFFGPSTTVRRLKSVGLPRESASTWKGWEYSSLEDTSSGEGFSGSDLAQSESCPKGPGEKVVGDLAYSTADRMQSKDSPSSSRREQAPIREPRRMTRGNEYASSPYIRRDQDRDRARRGKDYVQQYDDIEEDDEDREARKLARKEQKKKAKATQKAAAPPTPIHLPEFISVSNLAGVLRVRVEDFIQKMKELGFEETSNDHILDAEIAGLVAAEFNFEPIIDRTKEQALLPRPPAEDKSVLPARPPVVTIMGHVDHGKTTLLDYLRKSSVAASEHGGITQHIGAFSVPMPGGRLVTFLDTPGHEAFLTMRQRGAHVTDVVILVVAADDSVKPQTIEAIRHAQAAKVPMIVAVNKIDKEGSNVERVKQDLARYGVEIEDYGGDTQVVCVSGKTGQGMEELEDATVALADILDMRSEIDGQAEGWVLEATTKKAGRVATVLVRRGTLRPSDVIVAGTSWARVRSLRNETGIMLPSAGPGTPVEIDGWREQPAAGDEVLQAPDEQKAKAVVEYRLEAFQREQMATDMAAINDARRLEQEKREKLEKAEELAEANPDVPPESQLPETAAAPTFQEVFFIVKADVSGSVEAVSNSVSALGNSEVRPHILRSGVGPVTEFDIDHAAVAKGHIISFNTTVEGHISRMAESKDVKILDQSIIYRLVNDVKMKLGEKLPPVVTQKVLGEAEIAQVFEINTKGRVTVPIAGCRVRNGVISKTSKVRVVRDKEIAYDGTLSSLKNVKKDVTEMRKGNECGMGFESWIEFKVGDQVQAYEEVAEKRTL